MLSVAWIEHILADIVSHLFKGLPVLDAFVLEVENQLVCLFVLSLCAEKLLICQWMAGLEFLVGADDSVVDFDLL